MKSQIIYASPLFAFVTKAPSPAALLGKTWGDFYGHVDREKQEHFNAICKNVGEACESRFILAEKWWEEGDGVAAHEHERGAQSVGDGCNGTVGEGGGQGEGGAAVTALERQVQMLQVGK